MCKLRGKGIKKWLRILILDLLSEIWNYTYEVILILQYDVFYAIKPVFKSEDKEAEQQEKLLLYSLLVVGKIS